MAVLYRCIGYGFEKEEEKICSCPECGYKYCHCLMSAKMP